LNSITTANDPLPPTITFQDPDNIETLWLTYLPWPTLPWPTLPINVNRMGFYYVDALEFIPDFPPSMLDLDLAQCYMDSLPEFGPNIRSIFIDNLPNVTCLPGLPDTLNYFTVHNTGIGCFSNIPFFNNISTDIPMVVCNSYLDDCAYLNILGTTWFDQDQNGIWDVGEPSMPYGKVSIQPGNYLLSASAIGKFGLQISSGQFTIDAVPGPYQTWTSAQQTANIPNNFTVDSLNDLGLYIAPNIHDLVVDLALLNGAVPGFNHQLALTYKNVGSIDHSGMVTFQFDAQQTWVSSAPVPDNVTGNTATWNYSNLVMGEERQIFITLYTPTNVPLSTPLLQSASVDPVIGDLTPVNNGFELDYQVVGSFDPNDKLVEPSAMTLAELQSGDLIDYTIRFQNTGTAPAQFVQITDTLSADLDWNTFEFISSSHPAIWVLQDSILKFIFDGINLPDSNANEPASHGFAKFRMKPSDQLIPGDTILNTANIYFDFNEPVITDPALFEVTIPTNIPKLDIDGLKMWPNPVNDDLWLLLADAEPSTIEVLDLTGKVLNTQQMNGTREQLIDVSKLVSGIYFVRVSNTEGIRSGRFVKL